MTVWARTVFTMARLLRGLLIRSGRGAGGTLPGRAALVLHPAALTTLTRDRFVVLVSGTNGKSTTTALLTAALGSRGPVVSNADGSNLPRGLVSSLMTADPSTELAVLEVDEMLLGTVLEETRARVVVLLNLSRDQLDRVEEVSSHVRRWSDALTRHPGTHVVANADDPLVVAAVLGAGHPGARTTWVAAGSSWTGDVTLCPRCAAHWEPEPAAWSCLACGFHRPRPAWAVAEGGVLVGAEGQAVPLVLAFPGRSGIANAAMAVAAAAVAGVPAGAAAERLTRVTQVDGRYQRFALATGEVRLLLGKNPAGWVEVLHDLATGEDPVLIGINAQVADGIDPSWLWDVDFGELRGRDITVFGERRLDLSVRLTYADVPHRVAEHVGQALALADGRGCRVAANYTAFVQARHELTMLTRG